MKSTLLLVLLQTVLMCSKAKDKSDKRDSAMKDDFINKLVTFGQYYFLFNDPDISMEQECTFQDKNNPFGSGNGKYGMLGGKGGGNGTNGGGYGNGANGGGYGNGANGGGYGNGANGGGFGNGASGGGDGNGANGGGFGNGANGGGDGNGANGGGYGNGANGGGDGNGKGGGGNAGDGSNGDEMDPSLFANASPAGLSYDKLNKQMPSINMTMMYDHMWEALQSNEDKSKEEAEEDEKNERICWVCKKLIHAIKKQIKKGVKVADLKQDLEYICTKYIFMTTKEVCTRTMKVYFPEVYFIMTHRKLSSKQICSFILQPFGCYQDFDDTEWEVKPPKKRDEFTPCIPHNGEPKEKVFKIMHFSDIHLDIDYKEDAKAFCEEPQCCAEMDESVPNSIKAGKFGDYRNCDLPMDTVESAMKFASTLPKNDYILYTGGSTNHKFYSNDRMKNRLVIKQVLNLFNEYFPDTDMQHCTDVFDTSPAFLFPPVKMEEMEAHWNVRWMFRLTDFKKKDMCNLGRSYFGEDYVLRGYYTCYYYKDWNLRIISLNNSVCHVLNWWLLYTEKYIRDQLFWLIDVLDKAEENGQYVHIISRIPSGNTHCWKKWSMEYNKIIRRYSHIISAQFNGYTNEDEFNLFYDENSTPINVAWNGGSLTPYAGFNPNFKVYHVNPTNYRVEDVIVYSMDLAKANSGGEPEWSELYSFKKMYEIDSLSDYSQLHDLVRKIAHDESLGKKYNELRSRKSIFDLQNKCDKQCLKETACKIVRTQVFDDTEYENCLENEENSNIIEELQSGTPQKCPDLEQELDLYTKIYV